MAQGGSRARCLPRALRPLPPAVAAQGEGTGAEAAGGRRRGDPAPGYRITRAAAGAAAPDWPTNEPAAGLLVEGSGPVIQVMWRHATTPGT